jgi:asparagine synthase (glutamine-hydrolysing)
MCGICTILDYHDPVDADVLRHMNDAMWHRGPDDEGYHIAPGRTVGGIGLGVRRLSIIDLSAGRQPMCNEDGTVWVVFNGEIYNFQEIRRRLEAHGHQFRTNSDTEVIVHLYEDEGPECVRQFNGMFGLALWDAREETLFVARDRFGQKPVYYVDTGKQFLVASALKAILQNPAYDRQLDLVALSKYLAYEYVPAPYSIFKGVRKLPAGHWLLWRKGHTTIRRYWDLTFPQARPPRRQEEYAEEFRARFKEAIRLQLVADVPLGVFLSGGLDSSSLVALMSELVPPASIKTFSIGFQEPSFDESGSARRVAEFYGTDHHEQILTPQGVLDILPKVRAFLDEPFADASIVPTYLLSRFAREHVTVALSGDGGDELLAGYPTFQADRLARWYRVPRLLHERVLIPLADHLPVSHENFSLDFKIKRFLAGMSYPRGSRNQVWLGSFSPPQQRALLNRGYAATDPYEDISHAEALSTGNDPVERLIYLYAKFYLQEDILAKVDRASMACSLEARAPFLDHTFAEFLSTVPSNLKLKGLQTKHILRKAMAGKLPPEILARGKKGFGIPVANWFRKDLRDPLLDRLSESNIRRQDLFHYPTIAGMVQGHLSGTRNHAKQLWTLFMFQTWYDDYMDRAARASPRTARSGIRVPEPSGPP